MAEHGAFGEDPFGRAAERARQDKELTEQVAGLTREIHALLTKQA